MSFLASLFETRSDEHDSYIDRWLTDSCDYGYETASGAHVTEMKAMSLTTIYSCVRLIAWSIASLPIITYRELQPRGKTRAKENPVYSLLKTKPNPMQTPFEWKSLMSVHQNLWGAGLAEIEFDKKGMPVALWPLPTWMVTPKLTKDNRSIFYRVRLPDGSHRDLESFRVYVVRALTTSSYQWQSPITWHRENIGYSLAINEFGAKVFGQGTNPACVVEYDGNLDEESEISVRKELSQYSGLSNSHRLMLLQLGMKWQRVGLPPQDAQYIESRKWTVQELARIFNVPLHLLQDHEKTTSWGKGIEELNQGYVTFTLNPYLTQWGEEFHKKLLFNDEELFVEFLTAALLRGNLKARYEAYVQGRQNGFLSSNDVRELENMNPIPAEDGGDDYHIQLNMQKLDQVGENASNNKNTDDDTSSNKDDDLDDDDDDKEEDDDA